MSDRPWLEDGDPSLKVERSLLKKLNSRQPPSGSVDQGWSALSAEISGLQVLDSSGPELIDAAQAPVHGAAGLGIAAKLALSVALGGGLLWTGNQLLSSGTTSSKAAPQQQSNVPVEAPPSQRGKAEPIAPPSAELPVGKAPQSAGPVRSATTLAEEGRLLAKAHQLVQTGQAQQALEVLRTLQARYPGSVLYQEREVLTIEALAATGATGAARQRAERFLKRHPSTAHAGRLQRFVE